MKAIIHTINGRQRVIEGDEISAYPSTVNGPGPVATTGWLVITDGDVIRAWVSCEASELVEIIYDDPE